MDKKKAVEKLWRMGNLEWKLRGIQKEMRRTIYDDSKESKTSIYLVARRSGKSFTMMTIATEYCIRNPGSIVKVVFPKKKDAKMISKFQMRTILEDCPDDLKPEWKEADKLYEFPNGSEIQMAGTDGGSAESIRGSACHLALLDEAGFHDYNEFTYIVRSIIIPTLLTTKGKMIMASTPSKEPDHPFMTEYVLPEQQKGNVVEYDVYANPLIEESDIEEIAREYPGGVNDPDFRREFLLETEIINSNMVVPEFTKDVRKDIITQNVDNLPDFYDAYVAGDPAVTDMTVILFAYYDYLNKRVCVLDELVLGGEYGSNVTTQEIANGIHRKEKKLFRDQLGGTLEPFLRIMDNNNKFLLNDLAIQHGLQFIPTAKDKKDAQVNNLRMMIAQGELYIHPRCINTIYHLKTARWNKRKTGFDRIKGDKSKQLSAHHCDAVDALIYLTRNIDKTKDPYPPYYQKQNGTNVFQPQRQKKESEASKFVKTLFGISN